MKRISFLVVVLFLMGGMAMAQGQRKGKQADPKVQAERMTERMAKEYLLNDKQKKELLETNLALVEKKKDRQSEMKQEAKKEMKASHEAYNAQLKKILTKEQYDSYTKKQAERQQKMKDGHRGKRKKAAQER